MTPNEKEIYYISNNVSFDEETGEALGCYIKPSYDKALDAATRRAATDEDFDACYIFKAIAKVQNTPPELPVTTL